MAEQPARQVVSELQRRWTDCFNRRDVENLVALYAVDACLFGGRPDLSVGAAAVHGYFSALPPFRLRAEFGDSHVVELSPTVISSAGFIIFAKAEPGPADAPANFRITLTLVKQDGSWKIACHHASPVPA